MYNHNVQLPQVLRRSRFQSNRHIQQTTNRDKVVEEDHHHRPFQISRSKRKLLDMKNFGQVKCNIKIFYDIIYHAIGQCRMDNYSCSRIRQIELHLVFFHRYRNHNQRISIREGWVMICLKTLLEECCLSYLDKLCQGIPA